MQVFALYTLITYQSESWLTAHTRLLRALVASTIVLGKAWLAVGQMGIVVEPTNALSTLKEVVAQSRPISELLGTE